MKAAPGVGGKVVLFAGGSPVSIAPSDDDGPNTTPGRGTGKPPHLGHWGQFFPLVVVAGHRISDGIAKCFLPV